VEEGRFSKRRAEAKNRDRRSRKNGRQALYLERKEKAGPPNETAVRIQREGKRGEKTPMAVTVK